MGGSQEHKHLGMGVTKFLVSDYGQEEEFSGCALELMANKGGVDRTKKKKKMTGTNCTLTEQEEVG